MLKPQFDKFASEVDTEKDSNGLDEIPNAQFMLH